MWSAFSTKPTMRKRKGSSKITQKDIVSHVEALRIYNIFTIISPNLGHQGMMNHKNRWSILKIFPLSFVLHSFKVFKRGTHEIHRTWWMLALHGTTEDIKNKCHVISKEEATQWSGTTKRIVENDLIPMRIAVTFTNECPRLWCLKEWSCTNFCTVGESLCPRPTPPTPNLY